ncbi:tRNA-dihydrouridine(47) synthase [NAD(P)(+)]-like isoform X2 [Sceloporus undulatus]|uniref:tRNA-dihydrouridine(47) synthase [NAD(P)(+)]-like isoform X2 n=1 Tax=Sceloporus undulatus TaxID=8520 RepID=UPI001C4C1B16|nr:tRNA-dihydrouridine(47) synthase [NAD(P)(+)]-like isoform X2 [Sceloporus undulatus]
MVGTRRMKSSRMQSPEGKPGPDAAAASLSPRNPEGSGGGPATDSQDLEREPGKPPEDASVKPTEEKAPEEEKPLLKASMKEPELKNISPEGSGDGGGEGPPQPEVKPLSKRPLAAESPKPSPKKAKKSSPDGDNTISTASPQASHAEEKPVKEEQHPEAKAEQAKPESQPEALKKPPEPVEESSRKEEASLKSESAPSGPSSSSSDSGSKLPQSYSQGALLFGKPRRVPTAAEFSFRIDCGKDLGKSKNGGQSSTKKLDSMKPVVPPTKLWPSEGDGKKGNLPKMSEKPDARCIPTATKISFNANQDNDFGKSKDGDQSSPKKFNILEPGKPPARLWTSEGDGKKESLPKMSKEPEARNIPTAIKFSFRIDWDKDLGKSKNGGQSSTKKLDSMEPDEAPAELQNSEGDGEKESLPKMSKEPETRFGKNLNKKPKKDILCFGIGKDIPCFLGPLRGFPDDIEEYMAAKPPDLGDSCIHFSQFGKCQYWVTCRFASAHLGEGYQNVVNEELWKKWEGRSAVRNKLMIPGSGYMILKDFPFTKSRDYLFCLNKANQPVKGAKKKTGTSILKPAGVLTDEDLIRLRPCEKKKLDLQGKLYLSPLTKCGFLPFRRICKRFGADITCGEMLPCILSPDQMPGATTYLHRHETEDFFGIQGGDSGEKSLINNPGLFENIVRGLDYVLDVPVTVKLKTGINNTSRLAHTLIPKLRDWGVSMVTLHGRSSEGLYQNLADWEYIGECAKLSAPMPLFGNGDIFSFEDATRAMEIGVSGITIARAALIKPWIFTEIKERRHWDISARERLDMLKDFTDFGLEYWGSDNTGVEKTRHYLLNWLPFLCRYIPVGLLERLPPKMSDQHPGILYGDYLENLMSSEMIKDWVKISEMFLGRVPDNYRFEPAHNVDAYLRKL